tara:strand:+ start:12940 stop:13707 length:768 start_codon:yes stop_codon:yes gene_type:complete
MKTVGIIPCRLGSTRFPNKPLEQILDLPMIEHVRRRSLLVEQLDDVYIATCDEEIKSEVERHGGRVIMTRADHTRPSSRVAEAAESIDADAFFMIQGDEPLLVPSELDQLISRFKAIQNENLVLNLIHKIEKITEVQDLNVVKVSISATGRIINFTRSPLPCQFAEDVKNYYKQSGLILFSKSALEQFAKTEEGPLERAESVDMLRFLENDSDVYSYYSGNETMAVDLLEHVKLVESSIKNNKTQQSIYNKIMNR